MTESPEPVATERPTLKTIAAATGLAVATVSRALKDAPDIGESTKTRVRETALRLGYRPNRAGVRLRTGKTNVIALILSTESDALNHTSQLINSIAAALRGSAYHLVVMPYFPDQDPMDPVRYIVETESADGVILNQTELDDPRIRYLTDQKVPFATHGRTDMGIVHPYFDYDNDAFARLVVIEMARRGRKRLLLVSPPHWQAYGMHMRTGFFSGCEKLGLMGEILATASSDAGSDVIEAAVRKRLQEPNPPDGLIVGSTTACIAAVAGVEAEGFRLGVDIDIAGKEASQFLHRFRKELIVLREDVNQAGHFLARAVTAAIEHRTPEQGQHLDRPTTLSID